MISVSTRLLYLLLLGSGASLMAAMLTKEVQHNLQAAFKGKSYKYTNVIKNIDKCKTI